MIFNPAKCKFLVDQPFFVGNTSWSFTSTGYLWSAFLVSAIWGVWLDSKLCWREHIAQVSQKALGPLQLIQHGAGSLWGFHPLIMQPHNPICHVLSPLLCCPRLVWCCSILGAPSPPRSSDPSLRIGHPGPPSNHFWGGGNGAGGLPTCGDSASSVDRGVLPTLVGIRPEPHLCGGPLCRPDPRGISIGHLGCRGGTT